MNVFLCNSSADEALDTEAGCTAYLFRLKWPNGFVCPECAHSHAYTISTRRLPLYECANCRHQTSLTAGTLMEGSRTLLAKWFLAIRLLSDRSNGINATTLRVRLSVTYKTAWSMLHKIRQAIARDEQDHVLQGHVIIHDASYGRPAGVPIAEFHPKENVLLVGASVSEDTEITQISFRVVDPRRHIRAGALLSEAVEDFRYQHDINPESVISCLTQRYSPRKNKRLTPLVKKARQWLTGTFGGIGRKHLQLYLDEFCFCMNQQLAKRPLFEGISRICATHRI